MTLSRMHRETAGVTSEGEGLKDRLLHATGWSEAKLYHVILGWGHDVFGTSFNVGGGQRINVYSVEDPEGSELEPSDDEQGEEGKPTWTSFVSHTSDTVGRPSEPAELGGGGRRLDPRG